MLKEVEWLTDNISKHSAEVKSICYLKTALVYAQIGNLSEALRLIEKSRVMAMRSFISLQDIAEALCLLGQSKEAQNLSKLIPDEVTRKTVAKILMKDRMEEETPEQRRDRMLNDIFSAMKRFHQIVKTKTTGYDELTGYIATDRYLNHWIEETLRLSDKGIDLATAVVETMPYGYYSAVNETERRYVLKEIIAKALLAVDTPAYSEKLLPKAVTAFALLNKEQRKRLETLLAKLDKEVKDVKLIVRDEQGRVSISQFTLPRGEWFCSS